MRPSNAYRCFSSEAELKAADHNLVLYSLQNIQIKIEVTLLPCFYYSRIHGDPLFQTEVQHKVHTEVHLRASY